MNLFETNQDKSLMPLSEQLRPESISEILGQEKVLGRNSKILKLIESDFIPNLILWGPPGTGKTSFATVLSKKTKSEFIAVNATDCGTKELREIGDSAHQRKIVHSRRTILFVDEIHRFNKGQQDTLLPFVEKGDLILIGATTENPSYELNRALLSRVHVVVFERISNESLGQILQRAFNNAEKKASDILPAEAEKFLIQQADGDARRLLGLIELVLKYYQANNETPLTKGDVEDLIPGTSFQYDKNSEVHYDTISAFIKSIRGSDPDAAMYYFARMLSGGEDPLFIARRLVVLASEDIGNAEPRALQVAMAAAQAVEFVGLPEAAINLSQAITFLSSCPKSNRSYLSLKAAKDLVAATGALPIPLGLRSAKTALAKELGFGEDYQYPHESAIGYVKQDYLPKEIVGSKLYEPKNLGFEKSIKAYLEWLKDPAK